MVDNDKDQKGLTSDKPVENISAPEDELREFEENPYATDDKKPEDILRLFYAHNTPIIPVISKRGLLLGILKKDDVVSELSDIDRASHYKIDEFISGLSRKMNLDDLLEYGKIREFVIINLFGEVQGRWSRMQLFMASESLVKTPDIQNEAENHKEEQVLEWIIYLILEHVPRALYAINDAGKTIFYNSHFEDAYKKKQKNDVDTVFVENSLKDSDKNDFFTGKNSKEVYFYNKDLDIYYEKIPLISKKKKIGFLIYCNSKQISTDDLVISGVDIRGMSLDEIMSSVERRLLVNALKGNKDLKVVADSLHISRQALNTKMKKFNIDLKKSNN